MSGSCLPSMSKLRPVSIVQIVVDAPAQQGLVLELNTPVPNRRHAVVPASQDGAIAPAAAGSSAAAFVLAP